MFLEFFAALLRAPEALQRYSSGLEGRLEQIAEDGYRGSRPGGHLLEAWTIGLALTVGLQLYQRLVPGLVTPEVFERAFGLMAVLYQEP